MPGLAELQGGARRIAMPDISDDPMVLPSRARVLQTFGRLLSASLFLVSCAGEASSRRPDPLEHRIEHHVRTLASEVYAGRAPGTPGGEAAANYIEERLREAGVQPAGTDGFRQPVPLVGVRTLPATRLAWSTGDRGRLEVPSETFIAGWNRAEKTSRADGEAVFVGYGITAPEWGRDDMEGAELAGKWAVALPGEPPDLAGSLLHDSGHPVAKLYSAARHGAVGLLLLSHEREWPQPYELGREERVLAGWARSESGQPIPWLAARGAVVDSLSGAGNLWQEALAPGFHPRPLRGRLRLDLVQEVRRFESPNLLARLPGRDPALAHHHVCLSAHYDGLGRTAEQVYNGVIDNAVGVGELLEVAALARQEAAPRRSLLFFFPTAEEPGLLGSWYFVEHPTLPLDDIVGCLNKDGAPEAWGRSTDVIAVAAEASPSFAGALRSAVERLGLRWSPNPFPSEGFFFRSDHYSFLRAGVPGVLLYLGLAFEGRPPAWGVEQAMLYLKDHYHQSTDDLSRVLGWEGPAQYARVWLSLAEELANGDELARGEIDLDPGD